MQETSWQMSNKWANMKKISVAFSWWKLISRLYLSLQTESESWVTFIFIKIEQTVVVSWCISCWCFHVKQINSKSENRICKSNSKNLSCLLLSCGNQTASWCQHLSLWIYENPKGRKQITHFPSSLTLILVLSKLFSSVFILLILFVLLFIMIKNSCSVKYVQLCNHMTIAHQAPQSMGTLQVRILEWVAISFSRRSSWSRDQSQVSWIAGRFFTIWATMKAPKNI